MSVSLIDYLKVLDLEKISDITIDDVKKAFRKKVLEVHPDKGGDSNNFDYLLSAFVYVNNTLSRINGGRSALESIRSPDELDKERNEMLSSYINDVIEEKYSDEFNRRFEELHTDDLYMKNEGYSKWLSDESNSNCNTEPVPENEFNNIFNKRYSKDKTMTDNIIKHPNTFVTYSYKIAGAELKLARPETFTSELFSRPIYTDVYSAYTHDNIIYNKLPDICYDTKTLDDIIKERGEDIKPFTDEEKAILYEYERNELEKEKQRTDQIKENYGTNIIHILEDYCITEHDTEFIKEIK